MGQPGLFATGTLRPPPSLKNNRRLCCCCFFSVKRQQLSPHGALVTRRLDKMTPRGALFSPRNPTITVDLTIRQDCCTYMA